MKVEREVSCRPMCLALIMRRWPFVVIGWLGVRWGKCLWCGFSYIVLVRLDVVTDWACVRVGFRVCGVAGW